MNWKPQIFKPKWQSKDPAVRREAVATERDAELLDALPGICGEDPDPAVRAAAARRLSDLGALSAAWGKEPDPDTRAVMAERLRQLCASSATDRAPLEQRMRVVAASDDRELMESVASLAPEAELRAAALRKIDRQGFLGDRAIDDPDPAIRKQAASAIQQHSTLRRVIEATRTSDKTLHQALAERLHRELLEAGDPREVEREALRICEAVEHAALKPETADPDEVREYERQWAHLDGRASPAYQERFERDLKRLAGRGESRPDDPPPAVAAPPPEPEAGPVLDTDRAAEDHVSEALVPALEAIRAYAARPVEKMTRAKVDSLQKNWRATWAAVTHPSSAERTLVAEAEKLFEKLRAGLKKTAALRDDMLEQAGSLVARLAEELAEGALHKALETRRELQVLGQRLRRDGRWKAIQKQVNSMQGRLRELRGWQHWSNDKIRKRMIKEMEALPAAGLHPDAVLDRIKELQAGWKELEQSEQIPGDKHFAAAPWMWRKFNAAGRRAFEATKPFLDKRSEVRKKHLEDMRALCRRIGTLAASETADGPALGKALRQARKELRALGEVPAKSRHRMAGELKAALETGNAAMQAHYGEVEKRKLKLIREAAQLKHATDRDEAIRAAKRLQADWKAAGSLWRRRENELWAEFRAPLDPLFDALQADRQSEQEHREVLLAEQRALGREMRSILDLDDTELPGQHGKVQGLKDAWQEIRHPDRKLLKKFQSLAAQYEDRLTAQERRAEHATRERWRRKAHLLHQAEAASTQGALDDKLRSGLQKDWPEPGSSAELEQLLDGRFAALMREEGSVAGDPDAAIEMARKQCICLEFLAGIPSPDQEKDLRMQYQVDRLSQSMSGERKRMSAIEEAKLLESEWLALPFIPEQEYQAFRNRIRAAIEAILTDK